MSFVITQVELQDFRNYKDLSLPIGPMLTVVVGSNATGKTNLIEAIELMTAGESFRKPRWQDLIRQGSMTAGAQLTAKDGSGDYQVNLRIEEGRRSYSINGKRTQGVARLLGRLPSVVFTPDDLFIIKGPAEERRRTIDEAGDQASSAYRSLRQHYTRLLKQRNTALKHGELDPIRQELDGQFAEVGARLVFHRARLMARVAQKARVRYHELAGEEEMEMRLVPSWERRGFKGSVDSEEEAAATISSALQLTRAEELARSTTVVGPHRDDVAFFIDGQDSRTRASQGQQRSLALAWKLAEVDVLEEITGKKPVLLLDDVMSELDRTRREALAAVITSGPQTLLTTTNLDYFSRDLLSTACVHEMAVGQ